MDFGLLLLLFCVLGILGIGFYFLPSILARKDENFWKIFILNLLGAWTGILWFVALGWAIFYRNPKYLEGKDLELKLLDVIRIKGGRVTPIEISAAIGLEIDRAKAELDGFCSRGVAELHVTDGGSFVYVFRGFLSETEKLTARSPMDF